MQAAIVSPPGLLHDLPDPHDRLPGRLEFAGQPGDAGNAGPPLDRPHTFLRRSAKMRPAGLTFSKRWVKPALLRY